MSIGGDFSNDLSGDLSAFSMHDLFRLETGEQARALTDGLLLIERAGAQGADAATLEAMMRAAHSVKGAAAIVGLDPAVRLAHAMEDVLVSAQHGALRLDANAVDVLLDGVDLLQQFAALAEGASASEFAPRLAALVAALGAVGKAPKALTPQVAPAPATPSADIAAAPPVPAPPTTPPTPAAEASDSVTDAADTTPAPAAQTVSASDELLTLAGQARLHAGQLRPWLDALQRFKRRQRGLFEAAEQLQDAVTATGDTRLIELAQLVAARAMPLGESLHQLMHAAENYERKAMIGAARLVDEVLELRMCRFGDGVHGLPRMVRDLARSLGKDVHLALEGAATPVDRAVLARMEGPLNQMLRNAVDHGMETPEERIAAGKPAHGTIRLEARHRGGMLVLEVADDGRGVDPEQIRAAAVRMRMAAAAFASDLSSAELMEFLFLPGFSLKDKPTEISGRGVGLDIVYEVVQRQNGTVRAESRPGAGFRTVITLPLTQSIVRALVVDIAGEAYALPIARVERVLRVAADDVHVLAGRQYIELARSGGKEGGEPEHVGLVAASQVLALGEARGGLELAVIVIGAGRDRYGLVVDTMRGEQSLTVQPLEPLFGKLRDVAAAALLDDGAPVLILDVPDLLQSVGRLLDGGAALRLGPAGEAVVAVRRVLVVDDSLTVREMQRKLLSARGYRVDVAIDGIDGWNQLRAGAYDLVISDIDMPRLDGIALLERIRSDPRLQHLPVMIVSYKDRPEDRARGLEAGADYYLAKGAFHDATLLDAVRDLIGTARIDPPAA